MTNRFTLLRSLFLLVCAFALSFGCSPAMRTDCGPGRAPESGLDPGAVFMAAYPDAGMSVKVDSSGSWLVLNSTRVPLVPAGGCVDKDALPGADVPLCATLRQVYPAGPGGRYPAEGFDPGRLRNQELLIALYGDSQETVRANCVKVPFLGGSVFFNARHGAAAALARVAARLEPLAAKNPKIMDYVHPMGGTLNWRVVKATGRLSAHSFAIAIDLNPAKGVYWLDDPVPAPDAVEAARRSFPQELVDAFEAEGFIWGGKWHAFDLMHFEYRPELFVRSVAPVE